MSQSKLLNIFVTLVYLFLFAPLFIILLTAFGPDEVVTFPPRGFSLRWFDRVFASGTFTRTFIMSLQISFIATFIALLVGIPIAYAMSRYDFKGKEVIKGFFFSPVLIPGIVFGFSLFNFIIVKLRFPIYQSLIIGHTIVVLPYIIRVIGSSLENFDYSIEEAATSLGSSQLNTFFKIVLPNISSGVVAAFMLAFINSFNSVPVSIFITGPGISTLPISMMNYVEYYYDPTVSALSVILMIMTIFIMFIIEKTLGLSYFSK